MSYNIFGPTFHELIALFSPYSSEKILLTSKIVFSPHFQRIEARHIIPVSLTYNFSMEMR